MKHFQFLLECLNCKEIEVGAASVEIIETDSKEVSDALTSIKADCQRCGSPDFELTVFELPWSLK